MTQAGAAQPVVVSTDNVDAGPALRIAVVSDGRPVLAGQALRVKIVSDGRPTQGNPPIPVVVASAAQSRFIDAGPVIPVVVVSGSLTPTPSLACLGSAAFADMNTTYTNDLSADGITWAGQHGAAVFDSFGKFVQYGQRYNANTKLCAYWVSNDSGATFVDRSPSGAGEGFLTRGAIVYDAGRDCLHRVCITENAGDGGMIYRRDAITRDGSNNITAIARQVSVSLDDPSSGTEFSTILMTDANTLLIAWIARTPSGGEVRSCKCDITANLNAGGTASNWVHIGVNSTTTIGSAPLVASYTIPYTQAAAVFTYFTVLQLASGDLRWVYHSGAAPGQYRTRRSVRSAANVWNSLSTPAAVVDVQRAGTDTGYTEKPQLISQLSEDGSGNVYVGLATWASNALGDTWGIYKIAAADTSSGADVYNAGGVHTYAPTGDCVYDSSSGQVVVSYEPTTTEDAVVRLYTTALVAASAAQTVYSAQDVDIPLIYKANQSGKLYMGWRVQGSPPQHGMFGSLPWVAC